MSGFDKIQYCWNGPSCWYLAKLFGDVGTTTLNLRLGGKLKRGRQLRRGMLMRKSGLLRRERLQQQIRGKEKPPRRRLRTRRRRREQRRERERPTRRGKRGNLPRKRNFSKKREKLRKKLLLMELAQGSLVCLGSSRTTSSTTSVSSFCRGFLRLVLQAEEPSRSQELARSTWLPRIRSNEDKLALFRMAEEADLVPACPVVKLSLFRHTCATFCPWFAPKGSWNALFEEHYEALRANISEEENTDGAVEFEAEGYDSDEEEALVLVNHHLALLWAAIGNAYR